LTELAKTPVSFSERDFRDAMGSFTTGICVVTANNAYGQPIGMTVNSFSSVSLEPPLVLICLGVESPRSQAIINAGRFNLSLLSNEQLGVSSHFAAPGEGLAGEGMVALGKNAAPFIPNSAAVVECDMEAQYPGGDHIILLGRVTDVHTDTSKGALLYFRGKYRKLDGEI